MKPPSFDYQAPTDLQQALQLLSEYGDDAKILAGGQSLLPLLNMRLTRPKVLVDINRLRELDYVRVADGVLRIGALTRHRTLETSQEIQEHLPILREAVRCIGNPAVRTRGTIGGSLAHADPSAELPGMLTLLGGEVVVQNTESRRALGAEEFFLSYLLTTLEPHDLVVEVHLPLPPPGTGWAFRKVAKRHGDFALVGVAVLVQPGADGAVQYARIALIGCGATPIRALGAESLLIGRPGSPDLWEEAGRQAAEEIDPSDDIHASATYRRRVASDLVRHGLQLAWERAR